jgi:DNA-directed RNA polymerase specialized sigma24 family protein
VCNCPLGTVKSRLSYARQHLRGILSRENMEEWQ